MGRLLVTETSPAPLKKPWAEVEQGPTGRGHWGKGLRSSGTSLQANQGNALRYRSTIPEAIPLSLLWGTNELGLSYKTTIYQYYSLKSRRIFSIGKLL